MKYIKFTKDFQGYELFNCEKVKANYSKGHVLRIDGMTYTNNENVDICILNPDRIICDVPSESIERCVEEELDHMQEFIMERLKKHVLRYKYSGAVSLKTNPKDILSAALYEAAEEYEVDKKEVNNLLLM